MSQELTFSVPTLFGVEGLTADELRRLGLDQVRAENGRVFCQGAALDLARLNLNLRTGERVLLVLGSFPAADFDALFEGTRALPWERFIPREGQFPVKGHSLNSALHSVPACQSIVKKAIAARLGAKYGLNTLPETGALYQVQFSIMGDEAVLMLDTSGAGLHKRGYRAQGVAAPPAGDPGGGHGAPVPVPGTGPPMRPLLRVGDHPHRGRPHRQKPGPRPEPHLLRPEVGLCGQEAVAPGGGRGHGQGVSGEL